MLKFDALSVKARIQDRLKAKTSWSTVLFFSTNQRLIDAIAEEIAFDMQYDELLTTESKWSLAQQRSSLLAENQFFNYYPHRKVGASDYLKVSSSETFNGSYAKNIQINKFDIFSNDTINFVATESLSLLTNEFYTSIPIIQGTPRTAAFYAVGSTYETFTISNDSIENSTIDVYVNNQLATIVTNIREAETPTVLACTVDNLTDMSGITIRFGNDSYGKKLTSGDQVLVKYVETLGSNGNIDSSDVIKTVVSQIYDADGIPVDVYCTNISSVVGGLDYEDIEDIRAKAPRAYQTGQRAINKEDYASIIADQSFVKKVTVWGEAETNTDLGNIPGTYIAVEENVVHITAVSSSDSQLTETQISTIRDILNEKKPPTDIVVFENVNFIYVYFNVAAYVANKQYTITAVTSAIQETLSTTYSINTLSFKQPIRYSDYISLIDQVAGVDYHDTTVSFYKFEAFESAFAAPINIFMQNITPSTVMVYVRDTLLTGSQYVKIAHDNGSGVLVAESGYTVAASTINYNTGVGNIIVTSGLSEPFTKYSIKIMFSTDNTNIIPTKRNQFISYGTSTITATYE